MLTALLIALPLVASLFLFAIPGNGSRNIAVGVSALQLLITLALVFAAGSPASPTYVLDLAWIPSLGIHFHVGMDGIS
jgi:NADH-quinone oxidoreductase subunit M